MASDDMINKFNALPRNPKSPSGLVPNEWHFDIRYIFLEPTPSHILFILQPDSRYVHFERLPVGVANDASGMAFFPESAAAAAPAIARALVHAFVDNMGRHKHPNPPPASAPWALMTEESALAAAVAGELKALGVAAPGLHSIKLTPERTVAIATESFKKLFTRLCPAPYIKTPDAILFGVFTPSPRPAPARGEEAGRAIETQYYQARRNTAPPRKNIDEQPSLDPEAWQAAIKYLEDNPTADIKRRAEAGDPEAAYEYALRLKIGYEGHHDPALSRAYFVQAAESRAASPELRSTAHASLIEWYMDGVRQQPSMPSRYLFALAHHAEAALRHAEAVSPAEYTASSAVLVFLVHTFGPFVAGGQPELRALFPRCAAALARRQKQLGARQHKAEVRRLKQPNRYRCANPGCGIVADAGKALSRCSGKCDADKKPSYCSKECQTADWKNHKPFCKPGMPCSVLADDGDAPALVPMGGGAGPSMAIRVPDGQGGTRTISSSTMTAEELREMRDAIEKQTLS